MNSLTTMPNSKSLFRRATALLLTLLVAACGGGGGGTAAVAPVPTTAALCYDLTNGNAMRISGTTSPTQSTIPGATTSFYYSQLVEDITIQAATFNGSVGQSRITTGTSTSTIVGSTPIALGKSEIFYNLTTANQFNRLGARSTPVSGTPTETIYSGLLRSPSLAVGSTENYTYTYTTTGVAGTATVNSTLKLLAIEDVVTAVGTFKNACKFSLASVSPGSSPIVGNSDTFWYAPGWGNVKEIIVTNYADGRIPAAVTRTYEPTLILKGSL
jgi:hypothetical protein